MLCIPALRVEHAVDIKKNYFHIVPLKKLFHKVKQSKLRRKRKCDKRSRNGEKAYA
jgi:hypothetical protein